MNYKGSICGIHPYGERVGPDGRNMAATSTRCLEGVDLESMPVDQFDGRPL